MTISKCGFACDYCVYNKRKICLTCDENNLLTLTCPIYSCKKIKGGKYKLCAECDERLNCLIYKDGIRHCPIRISILTR